MDRYDIKTPNDVLEYMDSAITYGWVGSDGIKRIKSMDGFRTYYRTMSIKDAIKNGVGTCIEQAYIMHELLDMIGVKNKMFCTRMYEDETFNDVKAPERMHCFILCYIDDLVYQIEHPDYDKKGIYEYKTEEEAIKKIVSYYEKLTEEDYKSKDLKVPKNGFKRITTEFHEVPTGLTYKEFNLYINDIDLKQEKRK